MAATTGSSSGHFNQCESGTPYFLARSTLSLFFSFVLNAVSMKAAAASDILTSFVDPPFPPVPQRSTNVSSFGSSSLSVSSETVYLLLLGGFLPGTKSLSCEPAGLTPLFVAPLLSVAISAFMVPTLLHKSAMIFLVSWSIIQSKLFTRVDCHSQIKMPMKFVHMAFL